MDGAPNVAHLNAEFPQYPITVEDKGWALRRLVLRPQLRKSQALRPISRNISQTGAGAVPWAIEILHCPSGTIEGVRGITVDKVRDAVRRPQIVADACSLPFQDYSFDLVLSDPPYSDEDAEHYGTGHFPLRKAMREFHRVLRPHGHLALLHVMTPAFSTKLWKWVGMIGVVTGTNSRIRLFSIFECLKEETGLRLCSGIRAGGFWW